MAKVSKVTAHYRQGSRTENCRVCRFMNEDGSCDRVVGMVQPQMVCDLFQPTVRRDAMADQTCCDGRSAAWHRADSRTGYCCVDGGEHSHDDDTMERTAMPDDEAAFLLLRTADERRFTLGVAWHADRPDEQPAADGHRAVIRAEELEKTAWAWMARSREVGLMHLDGTEGHGTVVESYLWRGPDWTTVDANGNEQVITRGSWLVGVIWDPPTFLAIKRGQIDGYSPQGTAKWRKASA